jgi:hypothetical protein
VVKIGDSAPAPLLKLVAQPNDWQKQVRAATRHSAVTGKGALYAQFWAKLIDRVDAEHPDWPRSRRTSSENRIGMSSPLRSTAINSCFGQGDRLRHELSIDAGDGERNLEIFEHRHAQRDSFEAAYGRPLQWEDLSGYRVCLIADYRESSSVTDESHHAQFVEWFLDAGVRLRRAIAGADPPA